MPEFGRDRGQLESAFGACKTKFGKSKFGKGLAPAQLDDHRHAANSESRDYTGTKISPLSLTASTTESGAPIFLIAEIREIERRATAANLMEKAGLAAAECARAMLGDSSDSSEAVLVLVGPGNNGGDALVAARWLKQWWFRVDAVFFGDAAKLGEDAARAMRGFEAEGGVVLPALPSRGRWQLIVDGLFGVGLAREPAGVFDEVIARVNRMRIPILALDIPSGIDADSGRIIGTAIKADATITFIALKPGLLTGEGVDHCGKVHVAALDISAGEFEGLAGGRVIAPPLFSQALHARPSNSHKGMYGEIAIIGGARGMVGAALLAGRAALKLGAGKVHLGLLDDALRVDSAHPELMIEPAAELLGSDSIDCLVVGTGLGRSDEARVVVESALARQLPLVLDADALNLIGAHEPLQRALEQRKMPSVLTPHPGEAARLLGCSTEEIQNDRVQAARSLAARYRSLVVLKGAGTVCALADGGWFINPTGNAGMASGGMGDVLSGMLGALLGRTAARDAMLCAVYLHGAAADQLVARGSGPIGLTASEVADAGRDVFNRLIVRSPQPLM